jgi:hypothetical protein
MASRTLHRRAGLRTFMQLDEVAGLICRGHREAFLCDADAMAKSNTNRNHACVALATTSEAGAVDRRVVVHGLSLSAADIITSDGSAGGSPQPVTIADIVLYNDAGGVCCGASRRLAPPVLSEHAAIARASRGRRPRPGGIHFFARRDNLASSPSAYSSSYQQQASHHPRWRCCCF